MKKLAILLLVISTPLVHAHLIDETPGGFTGDDPFFQHWSLDILHRTTFPLPDSVMNQYFTVTGVGTPNGEISWDLTGTGYQFHWLLVISLGESTNLYRVTSGELIKGDDFFTVDGIHNITYWGVTGSDPFERRLPDNGSTLLLFSLAFVVLLSVRQHAIRH